MTDAKVQEYVKTLPARIQHMYRLIHDLYLESDHTEEAGVISDLYSVFYTHAKAHARKGRAPGEGFDPK